MDIKKAQEILYENDRGNYTIPTAALYPFQWNWDSCLTAMGWSVFDEKRGWAEIQKLFTGQWQDGMVPHILFHKKNKNYFPNAEIWDCGKNKGAAMPTSGITQPPLAAFAALFMLKNSRSKNSANEIASSLYPKILAWHKWFFSARDPHNSGLIAILHPWESGRDNNPEWDDALNSLPNRKITNYTRRDTKEISPEQRPTSKDYEHYMQLVESYREENYDSETLHDKAAFCMEDVGINAILLQDMMMLKQLGEVLNLKEGQNWLDEKISQMTLSFEHLWSSKTGLYHAYDRLQKKLCLVPSSAGFLPLLSNIPLNRQERLLETAKNWLNKTKFAMPSLAPDYPDFDPKRYWRGPIWAIVNYLLATGFKRTGTKGEAIAQKLREDTAKLIKKSGHYEYFNPETGEGLGGKDFSWTAAMHIIWKLDNLQESPLLPQPNHQHQHC